jgi:hypothetical protein
MKRFYIAVMALIFAFAIIPFGLTLLNAQEKEGEKTEHESKDNKTTSKEMEDESLNLDKQIYALYKDIQKALTENKLLSEDVRKNIKSVPFQSNLKFGKDEDGKEYIEFEKYRFIRSELQINRVIGVKMKSMRIYYSGSGESITKLETRVYDRSYEDESSSLALMVDPAPASEKAGEITFSHTYTVESENMGAKIKKKKKEIKYVDNKKMKDMVNTPASPIQNELKRNFIIPNLTYFYNVLLNVAETFYRGQKDSDSIMADYLTNSADY